MNFTLKSTLIGTATIAAVMGGTMLTASTAQALSIDIGNQFLFGSSQRARITATGFDFGPVGAGDGSISLSDVLDADGVTSDTDWETNIGATGTIKDVDFSPAPLPFTNFITINLLDPSGDVLAFDLLSAFTNQVTSSPGVNDTFSSSFLGQFRNASTGIVLGQGLLTAQVRDGFIVGTTEQNSTFSITVTAVPTPALVPAALGFGAAMLRKRKEEEAGKETAEAKA